MDVQLVIFLAFISVTLTANALVVWFGYKAFANAATSLTQRTREFETNGGTRSWLAALDAASEEAVLLTEGAKERMAGFESSVARAQSMFGFGLAKFDVGFERFCDNVNLQTERAQYAIIRPAKRIGRTISGVRNIIEISEILTVGRSAVDASSTQNR
jgi:hypothetical protein